MSQCYLKDSIHAHPHLGPFERCIVCGKSICSECIGRHLSTGAVWCLRCAAVSDGADRVLKLTSQPSKIIHVAPVWRVARPSAKYRIAIAFRDLRDFVARVLNGLAAPFRSNGWQPRQSRFDANLNLSFSTLQDKMQFGYTLVAVILIVVLGAIIYADLNAIPFQRVILVIALTCASWAVVAIYVRSLFDKSALGSTASQIVSYIIASFLAFLMASWFINWTWLDRLLGVG